MRVCKIAVGVKAQLCGDRAGLGLSVKTKELGVKVLIREGGRLG